MTKMVNDGKFSEIDEESTSAEESLYFGDLTKVEQALGMIRKVLPLRPGLQPTEVILTDENVTVKFCNGRKKVKTLSSESDTYASMVQKT